jgi:hypothetical protein
MAPEPSGVANATIVSSNFISRLVIEYKVRKTRSR